MNSKCNGHFDQTVIGWPKDYIHMFPRGYKNIKNIFSKCCLNSTFYNVNHQGIQEANGHYTGIIDEVYRNKTDFMFTSVDLPPNDFERIGVAHEYQYVVISKRDNPETEIVDITSSLLMFDKWTNMMILLLVLIAFIAYKLLNRRSVSATLTDTLGNVLMKNFSNIRKKLLFTIIWLIAIFFISHIFYANFRTDRVNIIPAKNIETLEDVVERDKQPTFFDFFPIYGEFMKPVSATQYEIGKRCMNDQTNCIVEASNHETLSKKFDILERENRAFIVKQNWIDMIKSTICGKYHSFDKVHVSAPLMSQKLYAFTNKYQNPRIVEKFKKLTIAMYENGLLKGLEKQIMRKWARMQHSSQSCMYQGREMDIQEEEQKVYIDDMSMLLIIFSIPIMTSILMFLLEKRKLRRTVQPYKG